MKLLTLTLALSSIVACATEAPTTPTDPSNVARGSNGDPQIPPPECPTDRVDAPTILLHAATGSNEAYWKTPQSPAVDASIHVMVFYKGTRIEGPGDGSGEETYEPPRPNVPMVLFLDYIDAETGAVNAGLGTVYEAPTRIEFAYGTKPGPITIHPLEGSGKKRLKVRAHPWPCYKTGEHAAVTIDDWKTPKVGITYDGGPKLSPLDIEEGRFGRITLVRDKAKFELTVLVSLTDRSATCEADYHTTPEEPCGEPLPVTFPEGVDTQTIDVWPHTDTIDEETENFDVAILPYDGNNPLLRGRWPYKLWTNETHGSTREVRIIDVPPPPPANGGGGGDPGNELNACEEMCGPNYASDEAQWNCCSDGTIMESECCQCGGFVAGSVCTVPI